MLHIQIITATHKQIPLRKLSCYTIPTADAGLRPQLEQLKAKMGLDELFYLATCNRIMYVFVSGQKLEAADLPSFFAAAQSTDNDLDLQHIQLLTNEAAVDHLFAVAASVDSLVVGERQILGQLRQAYEQAREWGHTGDNLRLLMNQAVLAAKAVYSRTKIGDKPVSVASLAIHQLLNRHLPRTAHILMIGAGQTNTLVAKFLAKHEYKNVTVCNRSPERATQVAAIMGGGTLAWELLPTYGEHFDALVVCTGATEPVVDETLYKSLLAGDTGEKIIVDLAIPHNVDAAIVEQYPVDYIEIGGLRKLAEENHAFRAQEVEKAKDILDEFVQGFERLQQERRVERAFRSIPKEIKAIKQRARNEVFQKDLDQLDPEALALFDRMLDYMEKKCVGVPMRVAREALVGEA